MKPIPRDVEAPPMSAAEIEEITAVVFAEPNPQPAAVLFVFGTSQGTWGWVADYWRENGRMPIIVAGKTGPYWEQTRIPVAERTRVGLVAAGVPNEMILVQDEASNTLEDVSLSLPLFAKLQPTSIAFVAKAHHSGRCWRTLRRFFVDVPLFPLTYTAVYDGVPVRREDWHEQPKSRGRVYGEFLRIERYASKGDIA